MDVRRSGVQNNFPGRKFCVMILVFRDDHFSDGELPGRLNRGFANMLQWVVGMGHAGQQPHVNNIAVGVLCTLCAFLFLWEKNGTREDNDRPLPADYCCPKLAKIVKSFTDSGSAVYVGKPNSIFVQPWASIDKPEQVFPVEMEKRERVDDQLPTPKLEPLPLPKHLPKGCESSIEQSNSEDSDQQQSDEDADGTEKAESDAGSDSSSPIEDSEESENETSKKEKARSASRWAKYD